MALWDRITQFLALQPVQEPVEVRTLAEGSLSDLAAKAFGITGAGSWRAPSVREALGVPAIQRAVSLIASTTGMLSMQGFRNGELMTEAPRLIARPDPFHTPYEFYSGTAAQMAKWGESVWWIASRDNDGLAQALVLVPLSELTVEANSRNRLFPNYRWQGDQVDIRSTRYSAANPSGAFVHVKYPLGEPLALRGEGPLQLAKIAISISVEAQIWAANFYGGGGHPSDVIKHAGFLDPTLRDEFGQPDPENGLSEADRLKAQHTARDSNTPEVIDQNIESITPGRIDEAGAQMLEARLHQNGDAARLFGLPGKFVEYVQSGTSLTYQSLESAFTDLIKTCLQPLYFEPIEQAMSDLLPRSTAARFNVKGFLRADIKTRYEVHQIAIQSGIYGPDFAQREEGIVAGDVEFQPILASPPTAIPERLPQARTALRDVHCPTCSRLVVRAAGPVEGWCRHCKKVVVDAIEVRAEEVEPKPEPKVELHAHFAPEMFRVESPVTVHQPDIHIEPTFNAPDAAPMTVQVEQPESAARIAAVSEQVAGLGETLGRMSDQLHEAMTELDERFTGLAQKHDELAAKVAVPRKPRKFIPERNDQGQIIGVTEAA